MLRGSEERENAGEDCVCACVFVCFPICGRGGSRVGVEDLIAWVLFEGEGVEDAVPAGLGCSGKALADGGGYGDDSLVWLAEGVSKHR